MRLKLSWDFFFFCTLSHWELGTSKHLTRVQNDRAARCFWYGEIPILVIQSILLKWISDYWIMLPRIFAGLNLMMRQNHFSSFYFFTKKPSSILFMCDIMVGFDNLKEEGHHFNIFQSILSSHVFCLGKLVRTNSGRTCLPAVCLTMYMHCFHP